MRGLFLTTLCLMTLLASSVARSEIRAVTDRNGRYVMTRVVVPLGLNVWAPGNRGTGSAVLNTEGALRGDLWPAIGEPKRGRTGWVLWSRYDNREYNIVWSRWVQSGWQEVLLLEGQPDSRGDDLDPDIAFDPTGRPFAVWWRDDGTSGQVLLSVWTGLNWMPVFRVSDEGVDSRYPTIRVESAHTLYVTYDTPNGRFERSVHFEAPVTITDDINPLNHLSLGASHQIEGN